MPKNFRRALYLTVLLVFCLGLGRAALSRFRDRENAVRRQCTADLAKSGLSRDAAKAKYPTPEIRMVSGGCVLPGSTGEVVIRGKFAPGTSFIFENDNLEVLKENLTPAEYRATVKIPAGAGPQTATVTAISPATCITARYDRAVVVTGKYEWTLDSANGWRIVARARGVKDCAARGSSDQYDLSFYRKGETAPFEKREAELYYSGYERSNYSFNISTQDPQAQNMMQNMQTLMQRLMDPKITDAERQRIMQQVEKAQAQAQNQMKQMTDPGYQRALEAKKLEFGCERIELEVANGAATGTMRCSQKVGTRIALTGSMKLVP